MAESLQFWNNVIKVKLQEYFEDCLVTSELNPEYPLRVSKCKKHNK